VYHSRTASGRSCQEIDGLKAHSDTTEEIDYFNKIRGEVKSGLHYEVLNNYTKKHVKFLDFQ
jgi:hypothetical protein